MSKHFGSERPEIGVDVIAYHTPSFSTRQHRDYLRYDGEQWRYSLNGEPITGAVNAWYEADDEAECYAHNG